LGLSAIVLVYAYWPANKKPFDRAASSILTDEDRPWR
jgi:cytochrome c oxidase cbb3-type subunit 4